MKKNSLIHFCSIFALCAWTTAGSAETLEEIYQLALENDHLLKSAEASYEAGKESVNLGRASLLPNINGSASIRDFERESTINGAAVPETSFDTNTTGYTISLDQTLFNLGAWHGYKSGAANTKAAEANFKSAEQSMIVRASQAYFDALKAVDDLNTATAEEDALKHQLEQTRQRFQVGLTAITEVHEAQAAFDSSRVNRLNAEGQLGIAFEALEVITGRPITELAPLKESFPVVNPTPANREQWVDFAMQNNHRLNAASLLAEAANQDAKSARAGHFPTINASASYTSNGISDNNMSSLPETDQEDTVVGLSLQVPLFTGGRTSATRRRASAVAVQQRENFLQTQRDVVQQTRSLHLAVVTGAASVKARAQAITSSQSALDATQAGYEVGTRDLVDVLNAQRNLFRAQRDYSTALYFYVVTTLQLKEAAGMLEPKDITELSSWLDQEKSVSRFSDS